MIHSYKYSLEEIGDKASVIEIKPGVCSVTGFKKGRVGESVAFEGGQRGVILSFDREITKILLLSHTPVSVEESVVRTGHPIQISAGNGLLGHLIGPLGYTEDDKREKSDPSEACPLDIDPPGVDKRAKITKFFETGVASVDMMVPIGEGQRELVMGDRKTGKTKFLLQTILSQSRLGKICIMALIGKKKVEIKAIENYLRQKGVFGMCILVASNASDSPGEVYITPYTALTLAEYFRDRGQDSFVILDDLTTHAKYYREISLVMRKFPGRESYPGDIFYIQSKILERAGNFYMNGRETSITLFPVAETVEGDLAGYIQTNLMGMTDGHIYFDKEIFLKGIKPAVNIFLSVTRVGKQTQDATVKGLSGELLKIIKDYQGVERFLRFGPEVTDNVKRTIAQGEAVYKFLSQDGDITFTLDEQIEMAKKVLTI